jgi:hypothetical protein
MTVTSHRRGHATEWHDGKWYYTDTGELADHDRPCVRCGQMPTAEGYDACVGYVLGAHAICCGHGVVEPFPIHKDRCLVDDSVCVPGHREFCHLCDALEERVEQAQRAAPPEQARAGSGEE